MEKNKTENHVVKTETCRKNWYWLPLIFFYKIDRYYYNFQKKKLSKSNNYPFLSTVGRPSINLASISATRTQIAINEYPIFNFFLLLERNLNAWKEGISVFEKKKEQVYTEINTIFKSSLASFVVCKLLSRSNGRHRIYRVTISLSPPLQVSTHLHSLFCIVSICQCLSMSSSQQI